MVVITSVKRSVTSYPNQFFLIAKLEFHLPDWIPCAWYSGVVIVLPSSDNAGVAIVIAIEMYNYSVRLPLERITSLLNYDNIIRCVEILCHSFRNIS